MRIREEKSILVCSEHFSRAPHVQVNFLKRVPQIKVPMEQEKKKFLWVIWPILCHTAEWKQGWVTLRSPDGTEGAGLTGCSNFLHTKYELRSRSRLLVASAYQTLFQLRRKQHTSTTLENPQYLLQTVNLVNLETEQKLKACCKVSAWGAEPGASKLVVWREIRNKGD